MILFPHSTKDIEGGVLVGVAGKYMLFEGITADEIALGDVYYYSQGLNIQKAYDFLTTEQREFIQNGMTPADWAKMPKEPEDSAASQ